MLRVPLRWRLTALAILIVLIATALLIANRALHARTRAATESADAINVPITLTSLDTHSGATADIIASTANFRDAAPLNGRMYLAAANGLYGFDAAGAPVETYLNGRELPSAELLALSQRGTELFIATGGAGLLIFNGTHFRQILPADPALRTFTTVLAQNSGRVLLGTRDQGLLTWDGKTLARFLPELKSAQITALAGSDADLWIGTLAEGVWRLHAGQLERLAADLPDPHVLSLAISNDTAFVGTPVGVVEFRGGHKARTLAEGYFARSLNADEDTLSVGTEDEGIATLPLSAKRTHPGFALPTPVAKIFRVSGARYALAGGLYRFDTAAAAWNKVLTPAHASLTDRNVASINVAQDGRVWVGYFDRGLDIADSSFENVRHFEDEHLFCINRIAEEPGAGRTAIATANGLVMMDRSLRIRQVLGRKDGLLADHVTDVLFRPGGMVIATPAGLSLAGAGGIRSLYVLHGLANNHVYSLAAAGGRIAAGTLGGLSLLDHDAVTVSYTTANSGLRHNWISALARVGDDWFAGTYGAGVMRLDPSGHWTAMTPPFEVNPNAMAVSNGTLYAGSLGKGLWVYNGRWRNIATGLPSLNVTAIAVGNGFVFAGTDNGLARFREGDLR